MSLISNQQNKSPYFLLYYVIALCRITHETMLCFLCMCYVCVNDSCCRNENQHSHHFLKLKPLCGLRLWLLCAASHSHLLKTTMLSRRETSFLFILRHHIRLTVVRYRHKQHHYESSDSGTDVEYRRSYVGILRLFVPSLLVALSVCMLVMRTGNW